MKNEKVKRVLMIAGLIVIAVAVVVGCYQVTIGKAVREHVKENERIAQQQEERDRLEAEREAEANEPWRTPGEQVGDEFFIDESEVGVEQHDMVNSAISFTDNRGNTITAGVQDATVNSGIYLNLTYNKTIDNNQYVFLVTPDTGNVMFEVTNGKRYDDADFSDYRFMFSNDPVMNYFPCTFNSEAEYGLSWVPGEHKEPVDAHLNIAVLNLETGEYKGVYTLNILKTDTGYKLGSIESGDCADAEVVDAISGNVYTLCAKDLRQFNTYTVQDIYIAKLDNNVPFKTFTALDGYTKTSKAKIETAQYPVYVAFVNFADNLGVSAALYFESNYKYIGQVTYNFNEILYNYDPNLYGADTGKETSVPYNGTVEPEITVPSVIIDGGYQSGMVQRADGLWLDSDGNLANGTGILAEGFDPNAPAEPETPVEETDNPVN